MTARGEVRPLVLRGPGDGVEVDALAHHGEAGLGEVRGHREVAPVRGSGDGLGAVLHQEVGALREQVVGVAAAAVFREDTDEADGRSGGVVRGDVDAGQVALGCAGDLPPLARGRAPVEEVELLLGGLVQTTLRYGLQRVGVEGDRVDAAQCVEEDRVVGFGGEDEAAGPFGSPRSGVQRYRKRSTRSS